MKQAPEPIVLTSTVDGREVGVVAREIILAGYTGRDRAAVQRHIDELAEDGIVPPPTVPALYRGYPGGIQVGGELAAGSGWCSGEIEYVLLVVGEEIWVGVGSDHTDRELERSSVDDSKVVFPKIISPMVWPLAALEAEWDQLTLRSWIGEGAERRPYQEGSIASILAPRDLLALVAPAGAHDGLVVYSGTMPIAERAPAAGRCHFEGQLARPNGEALATCAYDYLAAPGHVPMRMLTPAEAVQTFDEVAQGYERGEAIAEARRSLAFGLHESIARCPFEVDVPRFVGQLADGDFDAALATIREAHPFPGVMGRACHRYCEMPYSGNRMLSAETGRRFPNPTPYLSALERAAATFGRRAAEPFQPGPPTGRRVAVVGAGSGSLMCAWELRRLGHDVEMFERDVVTSGLLMTGYPSFRMAKSAVVEEDDPTEWGVTLHLGSLIDGPALRRLVDEYDGVFLGIGRTPVRTLGVEGDDLEGVLTGVDFLRAQWLGEPLPIGRRVVVIGGGFTALDVVRTAIRRGSEVALAYRRGPSEMLGAGSSSTHYVPLLEGEGVRLHFFVEPARVIGEGGRVVAIDLARTELGEPDERGIAALRRVPGAEQRLPADTVIRCVGETIDASWIEAAIGVERTATGLLKVDPITRQTSVPTVWAGGDAIGSRGNDGSAYDGQNAARAMDAHFRGELGEWSELAAGQVKDMRF